jgi:hypothetical protein
MIRWPNDNLENRVFFAFIAIWMTIVIGVS